VFHLKLSPIIFGWTSEMYPKPLPPLPPREHQSRVSYPVDMENNQDQNPHPIFGKAGVKIQRRIRGIRRVKKSVDGKPKQVKENENRKNRPHDREEAREPIAIDGEEVRETTALDGQEVRETKALHGREVRETKALDGEETENMRTLDRFENVPHDPEGTDWKKEYERKAEELEDLQNEFEHYDHQQGIRERALTFERKFDDPLHSLLFAEQDFDTAIKTLLDNYELRIKEREHLNRRYQSEHQRCIEKDDTLKAKNDHLRKQRASNETLRAQLGQEHTNAYNEGRANERSSWTVSWDKCQSEHQDELARKSLQLEEEQKERRVLETKVEDLETQAATAQSELSAVVHSVTQEHERTLETLKKNLKDADLRLVNESRILAEKHRSHIEVTSSSLKMEHMSKLKTVEEAHEKETERLETAHENELDDMKGKTETLKQHHILDIERREKQHAQEISSLRAEIVSLKETHTEALKTKDANHSSELSKEQEKIISLKERHATELEIRGKAHIREMSKLEARMMSLAEKDAIELTTRSITHTTELTARDQIHAEIESKLKGKMESLKMDHSAVLKSRDDTHAAATSKLKKQFRDHLAQREKEHAEITKALRVTVGDYSGALLERDKITYNMIEGKPFEPLLDADVEARFVGLAEEVDTLSRLDWKTNPSGWPEPVLLRLSSNQKTLKRQILKDTIWVILHEFVFCSPFRVFGNEGRALESKWNEECGAGKQKILPIRTFSTASNFCR
jgi:hypothetical protein